MRTIENKLFRLLIALIIPIIVILFVFVITEYPLIASIITIALSLIVLTYILYKFLTP